MLRKQRLFLLRFFTIFIHSPLLSYIYPYDFSVANAMVTNFHMPESTLLMLVAAYGGYELIMEAYDQALKEDYRFGTYGDAMLILDK